MRKNIIPVSVKECPTLTDIRDLVDKHLHILNINYKFGNVFKARPVITFTAFIGTTTVRHNQKLLKVKQNVTKGECVPCNTSQCLWYQQIIATITFEST